MKVLAILPNGEKDTMANLIIDGLSNTKSIELFKFDYSKNNYTLDEVIELSRVIDDIFVFWCKRQLTYVDQTYTYKVLDSINRPEIVIYIDGSEYNITGHRKEHQTDENLKKDPMMNKAEPWIDEGFYKRSGWYFKRETYKEDLEREKIHPLLVGAHSNYLQNESEDSSQKQYDMFCSFGHTGTGLRAETQNICIKLKNEGYKNIIGSRFPYDQYLNYIIQSHIGVSAWGAGNSCRRMWEIMSNKTCCFVQKKQIVFPNIFEDGVSYVEYSTPKEFEDKARYYLSNKQECIDIGLRGYEHIKKYHTGQKRVEYIFNILNGANWQTSLR